MNRDAVNGDARPWWLDVGDTPCGVCEDPRHAEVFVRCADCDRLLCPTCVVEVADAATVVLCADCAEARRR